MKISQIPESSFRMADAFPLQALKSPMTRTPSAFGAQNSGQTLLYGADGYLAKPFQVNELMQIVDRATAKPTRV